MINKIGKIILLGSLMSNMNYLNSSFLKSKFKNPKTVQELLDLTNNCKISFKNKTTDKDEWCINSYSVSKMVVNTYVRVLSLRNDIEINDITVYTEILDGLKQI